MNAHPLTLTCSLADQLFVQTKSVGIFNLSLGLVKQFARRPEISRLTVLANRTLADRLPENLDVRWHNAPSRGRLGRIWWDQWGVYSAATGDGWLLLPKGFASFLRPPPQRLAVYIHDAMHCFYRQHHPRAVGQLELAYFTRSLQASLRHASVCFTNTDFTAQEIRRLAVEAGMQPPHTVVAGVGFKPPEAPTDIRRSGLLVLASPFPHKRTALAVEWLAHWQEQTGFCEEVHWVGELPERMNWPDRMNWRHHPRLPEGAFRDRLIRVRALVFFSDYEGFGMPPVEAALAGACPVLSDIPATREVMGDCGYSFNNISYESFWAALDSALKCPPQQIAAWADTLLARHNWTRVLDRFVAGLQAAPSVT